MRGGWWLYALLLGVALAAGLAASPSPADSPVPSVTNRGPRGLAALFTWLGEAGVAVTAHDAPLTELPPGTATVVLPAPTGAEVSAAEVEALARFVEAGGALVYLVPRGAPQPALKRWLELRAGPAAPLSPLGVEDVGGATAPVTLPGGALADVRALRLSAEATLQVSSDGAVPVAGFGALWWRPLGQGELWLSAGADLAENARLELLDNARFWGRLAARGPLVFDEYHHRAPRRAPPPLHLAVSALQALVVAALFAWVRGARLGPPREPPPSAHRAALESVQALAGLARDAKLEPELVQALHAELRRLLHQRLGLPVAWPWEELAREAARRGPVTAEAVLAAARETRLVPLTRQLATLERALGEAAGAARQSM